MTNEHFAILREDIAVLREEIASRLDRMNGSVLRHEGQIAALQGADCPLADDVEALKQTAAANQRLVKVFAALAGTAVSLLALYIEFIR